MIQSVTRLLASIRQYMANNRYVILVDITIYYYFTIIIVIFIHLSVDNSTNILQRIVAVGYQRSHLAHYTISVIKRNRYTKINTKNIILLLLLEMARG